MKIHWRERKIFERIFFQLKTKYQNGTTADLETAKKPVALTVKLLRL